MSDNLKRKSVLSTNDFIESIVSLDKATKQIKIENLSIDNQELYQLLVKQETEIDKISETKKVIDIGAFVKTKVEMVMDTDYVNLRVKEMTDEFENGLEKVQHDLLLTINNNFDPAKSDSYTNKINEFFDKKKKEFIYEAKTALDELINNKKSITNKIDESFNPDLKSSYINQLMEFVQKFQDEISNDFDIKQEGSIAHQLKEMISQTIGHDGELVKTIDHRFSFDNPKSTINILQMNLLKKMDEIKSELIAGKSAQEATEAAAEKSNQKGYNFEDMLYDQLEKIAQQNGDIVENTSQQSGSITQSKKGDFVYHVSTLNKNIAIEAKNTNMSSLKDTLSKMEEMKTNRKADAVIWITANEEQLQKQVGTFQEYPESMIVTHFTLLEIAMKIAISRLMIENSEIEGIDRTAVETEINGIKLSLKSISSIKTAASNILKEANKIKSQADEVKNDITDSVENLSELLISSTQNEEIN